MIGHLLPLLCLLRIPSMKFSSLWSIFGIFFLLISPKGILAQQSQQQCLSNGQWGSWGAWRSCPQPTPSMSILNIQRRIRQCSGQPVGCNEAAGNFSCTGAYAEVQPCSSTTPSPSTLSTSTSTITLLPTTITITTTTPPTTTRLLSTPAPSTVSSTLPSTPPSTPSPTTTLQSTTISNTTSSTTPGTTHPSTTVFATPNSSVPQQQQPQTSSTTQPNPISTTITSTTTAASCGNQWNAWLEWSSCTETCGNCGIRQRFRSCNLLVANCNCPGSAFEKVACNPQICIYPKATCCGTFTPASVNNSFVCVAPGTVPAISAIVRNSISGTG